MSDPPVVCAVDIGTSAIRAAAVTADGRVTALRQRQRRGVAATTFDADALVADTVQVIRELTAAVDAAAIQALACSGHVGVVLAGKDCSQLGPAALWSDPRGVDLLAPDWASDPRLRDVTGRPTPTGGALALARWLRLREPERHSAIRWVLSPKDYVILRLTGRACTDATSAAYTLAFDVRQRRWFSPLLETAGLCQEQLPVPAAGDEVVARLSADGASMTGIPAGLPVAAGGPDGTLGTAAVVGTDTETVMDVAGTTDVLFRVLDDPGSTLPDSAVLNPYVIDGLWSYGGPTGLTGGSVQYMARLLGYSDAAHALAELGTQFDAVPPGSNELLIFPYLTGSRFPTWDHRETGNISGLTPDRSGPDILHAAVEGSAFAVREGIDQLSDGNPAICLAGGTAQSPKLAQLRAEVFNRPILVCADPEVSLRGAGILACLAADLHPSLTAATAAMRPPLTVCRPRSPAAQRYEPVYRRWLRNRQRSAELSPSVAQHAASVRDHGATRYSGGPADPRTGGSAAP